MKLSSTSSEYRLNFLRAVPGQPIPKIPKIIDLDSYVSHRMGVVVFFFDFFKRSIAYYKLLFIKILFRSMVFFYILKDVNI